MSTYNPNTKKVANQVTMKSQNKENQSTYHSIQKSQAKNIRSIDIQLYNKNENQAESLQHISEESTLPLHSTQKQPLNQNNSYQKQQQERGYDSQLETPKNNKKTTTQQNNNRDHIFNSLYNKAKVYSNHKQELKQREEENELKECFFSPKINRDPSEKSKRSLNTFLNDQQKFQNMKMLKQIQLKEMVAQEESRELTLKPKINDAKSEIGRDQTVPIHERLYNLKDGKQRQTSQQKMNSFLQNDDTPAQHFKTVGGNISQTNGSISLEDSSSMFSPKINSKSKSLKRKDHISVILYNDAKRRNDQQNKLNQSTSQDRSTSLYTRKTTESLTSIQLNERSEQVYTNSFIKQYNNAWNSVSRTHENTSSDINLTQKVDYLKMNLILELLLFITPSSQINSSQKVTNPNLAKERSLVYDIWCNLKGDKLKGISKRNLGLFLLALQGIKNPHTYYSEICKVYPGSCKNVFNEKQNNSTFNFETAADIAENTTNKKRNNLNSSANRKISTGNQGSEQNNSVITNRITNLIQDNTSQNNNTNWNEDQKFNETMRQLAEKITNEQIEQKRVHGYFENENWFIGDDQFSVQMKYDLLIKNRLNQQSIGNLSQRLIQDQQKEIQERKQQSSQLKKKNASYMSGKIISIDLMKPKQSATHHIDLLVKQRNMQLKIHEETKKNEKDKELEGCTFQPNIERNRSKMNNTSLGMEVSLNLYKTMFKTSSSKRDKSTYDIEYEKQCDQCTFTPDISQTKNFLNTSSQQFRSQSKSQQQQQQSQKSQLLNRRDFESSVERIQQARKINEGQNLMHQRGYHELPNYQTMTYVSNISDKQKQSFFSTSQGPFRTFDS